MSPYGEVWSFTRERLAQAYQDLSNEQLRWRPSPDMHNIGELIYHIAGAECWFSIRMRGLDGDLELERLAKAARSSFISTDPFPFSDSDMDVPLLDHALAKSASVARQILEDPTPEQLKMPVETVIGPVVEGVACLWRLAQHSAYHTGQIWTYRMDPRFPT